MAGSVKVKSLHLTPLSLRSERTRREVKRRRAHVRPSKGLSPPAKRRPSASEPQFELAAPLVGLSLSLSVYVCVCVCERERERELRH